ncbi:MAG: hypothetical protein QW275_01830 [Candidatus Anstonellaceae archaeon]
MRKLLAFALVIIAALSLFFLIFYLQEGLKTPPPSTESRKAETESTFSIRFAKLANHGQENVVVMELFLKGRAKAFCSSQPIQRSAVLLSHPSAPGIDEGVGIKIADGLEKCGFSVQKATPGELDELSDTIIIAPSGAVPKILNEKSKSLALGNNRIYALAMLDGRLIDEEGNLLAGNISKEIELVRYFPESNNESIWKVMEKALTMGQNSVEAYSKNTIAIPINSSIAYCRVFGAEEGRCKFFDSGKLQMPQGRLEGPKEAIAGSKHAFVLFLGNSSEIGRNLTLYASASKGQVEVWRQKVFEGRLLGGHESRFLVQFPSPGDYVISVEDQFGRTHAQAYVKAVGLSAREVSVNGRRYEYYLEFGGAPATGHVQARIGEGEAKDYFASNGTLVVWAAPSGNNSITFLHNGATATLPIKGEQDSIWMAYLRLYIPAAVFLIAVYLLIGASRKEKYIITFPKLAQGQSEVLKLGENEVLQSCKRADLKIGGHNLALLPQEIGRSALQIKGKKSWLGLDMRSLIALLEKMREKGSLVGFEGYYAPKEFARGFDAKELVMLRRLYEAMLEKGIPFRKSRLIELKGKQLQIFSGKGKVLAGLGKKRRIVLFASKEDLLEFEKSLEEPSEENTKIKLAISNRKIALVEASREMLEAILP